MESTLSMIHDGPVPGPHDKHRDDVCCVMHLMFSLKD